MKFTQNHFFSHFKYKKELLVYLQFRHCFRLYLGLWFFAILFLYYANYRLEPSFRALFDGMTWYQITGLAIIHSFIFSFFKALISAFIDLQFQKWLMYRKSLYFIIIIRLLIHFIVLALVMRGTIYVFADWDTIQLGNYIIYHAQKDVLVIYSIFIAYWAAFLLEMDRRLGAGNLRKLYRGKFYRPSEDYRIFMFVDLQSSTTIAEQLGHIDFSRLLQDCFSDFSVVGKYGAEVYQHVGDEVVVSWGLGCRFSSYDVLDAFYAFEEVLESRKDYYLDEYGVFPQFRAGAHIGKVTVAEVGELKREICYHGDTLNTTARILALCKEYDSSMLISDKLREELGVLPVKFKSKEIGKVMLKGKTQEVGVFSIDKNSSPFPKQWITSVLALFFLASCEAPSQNLPELPEPEKTFELSTELNEISGLCFVSASTLASLQDENGILYFINTNSGSITKQISFGKDGDYEGITLVKDTYFILRSDGDIYSFHPKNGLEKYKFKNSEGFNFEGLCYDKSKHRLLVACKEHPLKKHKKNILIYSFDLKKMKYDQDFAFKLKRKDLPENFKPSGITIHENQIYLLSFTAQKLAVLSSEGKILKLFHLPDSTFAQPEGITFDSNGHLYISNEANGNFNFPNLLKFNAIK